MYIWIILMLLGVFIDQISKYLVVIYMDLHESVSVIPHVLNFTYIRNTGAAFGSFTESRWVFMIASTVMIVAILVFMLVKKPKSKLLLWALTLIVSGGIGNMIDRIRLGYVIDFIDFCAFPRIWMWTFNIADSCVVIGAGLIILYLILDTVKESKRAKVVTSEAADTCAAGNDASDESAGGDDTKESACGEEKEDVGGNENDGNRAE